MSGKITKPRTFRESERNGAHSDPPAGASRPQSHAPTPDSDARTIDPHSDAEALLNRMRAGDRDAAAEFVTRYESRIRRRIRGKLGPAMRRLFDSQDILSTLGRRLDRFVRAERVEARTPDELWSLIMGMANNAVVDKARVYRRLRRVERDDAGFADLMLTRLNEGERARRDPEIDLEAAFDALKSEVDRQILTMWLTGSRHAHIANSVGLSPDAVRQRWQTIKSHLRERFASHA
ncbi:MAG: sigma-70 family RNA polymerase sigma factor [Phycisphaerales bacterium]|nr:MAG: sigma-70 family RNA polymerase sigma factor [Phycisphaerales bacterium]